MKRLYLLMLVFLTVKTAQAAEHWDVYPPNEVPWTSAHAMAVFDDTLFVSGLSGDSSRTLWKTDDGKIWEQVVLPVRALIVSFTEHEGFLYGFTATASTSATPGQHRRALHWNGSAWLPFDNLDFVNAPGTWSDSISFGGYIYAAGSNGNIWRSPGGTPSWQFDLHGPDGPLSELPVRTSFALANGVLYAARVIETVPIKFTEIWKRGVSTGWVLERYVQDALRPGNVVFNGHLYWGGIHLWKVNFAGPNPVWTQSVAGNLPVPFVLNNELRVYGPSGPSSANTQVFCATDEPRFHKMVQFQGDSYIIPCDLWRLRPGLHGVSPENFVGGPLSTNQKQATVLAFSTDVNFSETVDQFEVVNLESARADLDLERVQLYQAAAGSSSSQFLVELVRNAEGNRWGLPPLFVMPVHDGQRFFITVDVANDARIGTACLFALEDAGLHAITNTEFQMQTLVAPGSQLISGVAGAVDDRVNGVIIFPSPARTQVNFLMTLNETSDVTIDLFNLSAEQVSHVAATNQPAADRVTLTWDATLIPSGVYYALIKITGSSGQSVYKEKVVIEK